MTRRCPHGYYGEHAEMCGKCEDERVRECEREEAEASQGVPSKRLLVAMALWPALYAKYPGSPVFDRMAEEALEAADALIAAEGKVTTKES